MDWLYHFCCKRSRAGWIFLILLLLSSAVLAQSVPAAAAKDTLPSDEWDVAMAADGFKHVYVLYQQYQAVQGCAGCASRPAMTLVMSTDDGLTWQAPRSLTPPESAQVTPAITVDAADHKTLYATWLERGRQDVIVARSSDFGQSWYVGIAARAVAPAEKPVIAASGQNVYVAFTRDKKLWAASSHDGGVTFALSAVDPGVSMTGALAGGATIDPQGSAYVAWSAYVETPSSVNPQVNLYISKSADSGKVWNSTQMDVSRPQPKCADYRCKWGYLGAEISIASDSAGTLYAFWNSAPLDAPAASDPARVYFSTSTTAGETWSPKAGVSDAPAGANHVLPTIAAGSAGEVRIAWIDSRHSPDWSAFYRTSTNGGATWSPEKVISTYLPTTSYIPPEEFDSFFGKDGFGQHGFEGNSPQTASTQPIVNASLSGF